MKSFSIFLIGNFIRVGFFLISIKPITLSEINVNNIEQSNDKDNEYYFLENEMERKIIDEEDSRSILNYILYNEHVKLNARVSKDIDRIILDNYSLRINYIAIFVNNEQIDDVTAWYSHNNGLYTIYFPGIIPAGSNLLIEINMNQLSLLTLKNFFQFDDITLTNHDSIDSNDAKTETSLSAYFLAAFMSEIEFAIKTENISALLRFKLNLEDEDDNSLLKNAYRIYKLFQLIFEDNTNSTFLSMTEPYQFISIINANNFSKITIESTKTLQEMAEKFDDDKQQYLLSNLLYEWSYIYLNLIRKNLEMSQWIVKGLSTYFQYYGITEDHQIFRMHCKYIDKHLQPSLTTDALKSSNSIMSMSSSSISANILLDSKKSIDSKISILFRMLHLMFGSSALRHTVREFYQLGKHSNVTLNNFWSFIQSEAFLEDINLRLNIRTVMESWTKQAGYPLLTVNVNDDSVKLHQSRFIWQNVNTTISSSDDSVWWIPVTWITKNTLDWKSMTSVYWFNTTHDKLIIPKRMKNDWIIFNTARMGFYRVNYDRNSWKRILDTLNSNSFNIIPEIARIAILDDIINLAKTGHIPIDIYVRMLDYGHRENFLGAFKIILKELMNLHESYSETYYSEQIDEFIFGTMAWMYSELNVFRKLSDKTYFLQLQNHVNLLIDDIKVKKCISSARNYWGKIKNNTEITEKIHNESYDYCLSLNKNLVKYNVINSQKLSYLSAVKRPLSKLFVLCSKILHHQENFLGRFRIKVKTNVLNSHTVKKINIILKNVGNCQNNAIQLVLNYLIQHPTLIEYYCNNDELLFLDLISSFSQKLIKSTIVLNQLEELINATVPQCSQVLRSLSIIRENKEFENKFYENNYNFISSRMKNTNDALKKYEFINFLLLNDIIPIHYEIQLTPHMNPENFYFDGKVIITAEVKLETSKIRIHSHKLTSNFIKLTMDDKDVVIAEKMYYKQYQFLVLKTSEKLRARSIISIIIQYTGEISQEKRGLYRDFYIDHLNQTKWFAATNLERGSARRLFPCFDEPFFKTIFKLSINRTPEFRAVSNMKLETTIQDNDRYIDYFERSSELSTHQIAFVLSEFNSFNQVPTNFTWFDKQYTFEEIYPIIQEKDFFKEIETLIHPTKTYDYRYVDELAQLKNQLENYNLISFKGKNIVTNSNYVSLFDTLTYVVNWNYEMMYRFFSNYLPMNYWRCEWFNRAISYHFLSISFENNTDSKTEISALFIVHHLQPSMLIDVSPLDGTFIQDDYTVEQINNAYNKFTDDKGTSILRMIENLSKYSDTVHFFQSFVTNIIDLQTMVSSVASIWGNCPGMNKFCELVETEISVNPFDSTVNSNCILKDWLRQKGFPVVHVKIENNTVLLLQTPFQYNSFLVNNSKILWNIPITWTSSINPDFSATKQHFFLKHRQDSFQIDEIDINGWVILNLQQIGYYRVNYDFTLWNRIIKVLKSQTFQQIHENNRAAIIDDLFNLARGGYVNYTMALKTAKYLTQEKSYAPWKAAFNNFAFLDKRLVAGLRTYENFRIYVKILIKNAFEKLGFNEQDDDGYSKSLLRINILEWACKYKYLSCILECKKLFYNWKFNPTSLIPIHIRSIVYCTAINNGNEMDWLLLFNEYKETKYQSEKDRIIKALTCTRKSELLHTLLLHSITKNIELKTQNSVDIFSAVYSSGSNGVSVTLSFINKYYSEVLDYFENYDIIKGIFKGLVVHITTPQLVKQFNTVLQNLYTELLPIKETILLCLNQTQEVIMWHNIYFSKISTFLEKFDHFKKCNGCSFENNSHNINNTDI